MRESERGEKEGEGEREERDREYRREKREKRREKERIDQKRWPNIPSEVTSHREFHFTENANNPAHLSYNMSFSTPIFCTISDFHFRTNVLLFLLNEKTYVCNYLSSTVRDRATFHTHAFVISSARKRCLVGCLVGASTIKVLQDNP